MDFEQSPLITEADRAAFRFDAGLATNATAGHHEDLRLHYSDEASRRSSR